MLLFAVNEGSSGLSWAVVQIDHELIGPMLNQYKCEEYSLRRRRLLLVQLVGQTVPLLNYYRDFTLVQYLPYSHQYVRVPKENHVWLKLYIKKVKSGLVYNRPGAAPFRLLLSLTSQIWSDEKVGAMCLTDDAETLHGSADRRTSDRHDSVVRPE